MAPLELNICCAFDASKVIARIAADEGQAVADVKQRIEERTRFPAEWQILLPEGGVIPLPDGGGVAEEVGEARTLLLVQQLPRLLRGPGAADPDAEWRRRWQLAGELPSPGVIRYLLPLVSDPSMPVDDFGFSAARVAVIVGASLDIFRAVIEDPRVNLNEDHFESELVCGCLLPVLPRLECGPGGISGSLLQVAVIQGRLALARALIVSGRLSMESRRKALGVDDDHVDLGRLARSGYGHLVYRTTAWMERRHRALETRRRRMLLEAAKGTIMNDLSPAPYDDWTTIPESRKSLRAQRKYTKTVPSARDIEDYRSRSAVLWSQKSASKQRSRARISARRSKLCAQLSV